MTTDIINQLVNQYTGSLNNIQAGSIALGKELFNSIALISIAVLGINHLLRKNVDLSEANIDLIRWLIYLDFFYAFITNFSAIYSFIFASIGQIADYLGAKAAGQAVDISAANIFHIGISLALKVLGSNITLNLFRNLLYPLVSVVTAVVILFCFASIGLELILVQIGSKIILAGGIFLLAFSGFQWTREYAERYVHTFFHIGIKIVFIYILVGLGEAMAQNWSQVVVNAPWQKVLDNDIAVCLAAYIYYKLCVKVPDQAVAWLAGRFPMSFETFTDVKSGVKLPGMVRDKALDLVHAAAGINQAMSAAGQAAKLSLVTQGKKANQWNTAGETIKTLGRAWKQETWDKQVDATMGGKMTKTITDGMKKAEQDADNDPSI